MIAYSTDAPLYHRPMATIALIVLNILLFVLLPPTDHDFRDTPALDNDRPNWGVNDIEGAQKDAAVDLRVPKGFHTIELRLNFGSWNPLQWVSSPLLHTDLFQLLFNMIALWTFGLVVEGKVGWRQFLILYFGIAITQAAIMQTLFLFGTGIFGGANAAVLGLLGLAVVWAPKNNFDVWFGYYFGSHEVSILIYGFVQFCFGVIAFCLGDNGLASGFMQLFGLGFGIGLGFLWLQRGWVDCEGWDLVRVLKGEHGQTISERDEDVEREANQLVRASLNTNTPRPTASTAASPDLVPAAAKPLPQTAAVPATRKRSKLRRKAQPQPAEEATDGPAFDPLDSVQHAIDAGNFGTAHKILRKLQTADPAILLSQPMLAGLMRGLLGEKDYATAIPIMEEHIQRFPTSRISIQLNLVKIMLFLERPSRAISILKSIDRSSLDAANQQRWKKLASHAKQQIDDGVVELSD